MSLKIEQIDKYRWRIPKQGNMRTDGIIYTTAEMLELIKHDESLRQVANVACLPGIIGPSLAMPDIHAGYGFPIGGVAAFDLERGVISPGGVGYDINCGVRLLRSNLKKDEVLPVIEDLEDTLYVNIPTGDGSARKDLKLKKAELKKVL